VSASALALPRRNTPARRRAQRRRRLLILGLMSPWIVGFCVFFGYPLVYSAYLSFTHYDLLSSPRWIGTANYDFMLHGDPNVGPAVRNTLWMIAVLVPLQVILACSIAMLVARARRGVGIYRTIFYLPALTPPVAATLGFLFLLNPSTGPVNTILGWFGITGPLWFDSPHWAKPSLVLLGLWGIGNTMVIFLAAVVDVPRHLLESAELDGAGYWRRLRWVTLPSISPVILFAVLVGVIDGLQYFTQAYVAGSIAGAGTANAGDSTVTLGYPENSTLMYPVLLYQQGFRYFNMGYAAALSIVLFGVALLVTVAILRSARRFVHYQGAART
jgi:multiple sugar transport system permease protein